MNHRGSQSHTEKTGGGCSPPPAGFSSVPLCGPPWLAVPAVRSPIRGIRAIRSSAVPAVRSRRSRRDRPTFPFRVIRAIRSFGCWAVPPSHPACFFVPFACFGPTRRRSEQLARMGAGSRRAMESIDLGTRSVLLTNRCLRSAARKIPHNERIERRPDQTSVRPSNR